MLVVVKDIEDDNQSGGPMVCLGTTEVVDGL